MNAQKCWCRNGVSQSVCVRLSNVYLIENRASLIVSVVVESKRYCSYTVSIEMDEKLGARKNEKERKKVRERNWVSERVNKTRHIEMRTD